MTDARIPAFALFATRSMAAWRGARVRPRWQRNVRVWITFRVWVRRITDCPKVFLRRSPSTTVADSHALAINRRNAVQGPCVRGRR